MAESVCCGLQTFICIKGSPIDEGSGVSSGMSGQAVNKGSEQIWAILRGSAGSAHLSLGSRREPDTQLGPHKGASLVVLKVFMILNVGRAASPWSSLEGVTHTLAPARSYREKTSCWLSGAALNQNSVSAKVQNDQEPFCHPPSPAPKHGIQTMYAFWRLDHLC